MPLTQTDQQLPIAELLGDCLCVLLVSPHWIPAGSSSPAPSHPESPLTPPVHSSSSWWTHSSCSIPHQAAAPHCPQSSPKTSAQVPWVCCVLEVYKNQPHSSRSTLAVWFTCGLCTLGRLFHALQISHQSSQMPSPVACSFLQYWGPYFENQLKKILKKVNIVVECLWCGTTHFSLIPLKKYFLKIAFLKKLHYGLCRAFS